ncbi:MAG: hypothetical protein ACK5U7_04750 [Bacteroidota bacterium]|jgi:hypothetical protein
MRIKLNPDEDFYADPERLLLFKDEHKTIPSNIMWALMLCHYPTSQFFNLDLKSKEEIIKIDYLNDPKFNFDKYKATINKIKSLLTPAERLISTWYNKLLEQSEYLDSLKFSSETVDTITKIMKDSYPMMKQFKEIESLFLKEQEQKTLGNIEESLLEKGII